MLIGSLINHVLPLFFFFGKMGKLKTDFLFLSYSTLLIYTPINPSSLVRRFPCFCGNLPVRTLLVYSAPCGQQPVMLLF